MIDCFTDERKQDTKAKIQAAIVDFFAVAHGHSMPFSTRPQPKLASYSALLSKPEQQTRQAAQPEIPFGST